MNDFFSIPSPGANLGFGSGYGATLGSFGSGASLGFGQPVTAPVPLPRATMPAPSPNISTQGITQNILNGAGIQPQMSWGDQFKATFMNEGGGFNLENIGSIAETIGALGTLWSGIQSNRIARDSLNMQKKAFDTNLRNQTQSYNNSLEDRITARYAQHGRSGAAEHIAANRLEG